MWNMSKSELALSSPNYLCLCTLEDDDLEEGEEEVEYQ